MNSVMRAEKLTVELAEPRPPSTQNRTEDKPTCTRKKTEKNSWCPWTGVSPVDE